MSFRWVLTICLRPLIVPRLPRRDHQREILIEEDLRYIFLPLYYSRFCWEDIYLYIWIEYLYLDRNVTKTEHTHKLLLCFITKNEENRGVTRVTRIKILSLSLSLSQTSAWSRNHIKVNIKRDSIFGFIYNETLNKWPNHWLTSIRLTRFLDRDIPRAFLFLSSSGFFFFFFFCMMMMTMSAMSYPV